MGRNIVTGGEGRAEFSDLYSKKLRKEVASVE